MPVAVVAVPAIFAVIVLLAAFMVIETIGRTIGASLPLPGLDVIGRWIARTAGTVINAMAGFLGDVARGIENFINVPVNALRSIFQSIANALARFAAAIQYIMYQAIPNLFTQMDTLFFRALDFARTLVVEFYNSAIQTILNVENYLLGQIAAVENLLAQSINWVYNTLSAAITSALNAAIQFATGVYNSLVATITSVENFLMGEIQSAIASVEHYAQELANWALNTAISTITAWAVQYIDEAIGIARRDLDALIAGELATVWPTIIDNITGIAMSIPTGVQWVLDHLGAIERSFPVDIASALFDLTIAIDIPLRWMRECGMKLCSSLGGFGNEMDNLADDALIALIVALTVAAVEDPSGLANETHQFASGPLRAVGEGFKSLITQL